MINRKYEPDFTQLLKVLHGEKPDRPVLFEYFTNGPLNEYLAGRKASDPGNLEETISITIDAFTNAGYDYVTIPARFYGGLKFTTAAHNQKSTVSQNDASLICDRATFESYPWPDPEKGDFDTFNRWQRWGDRIAILGGIDMDFLVRATPEQIHHRAEELLKLTGSKGYALGSGNSIPAFVPVENYLAMISAV